MTPENAKACPHHPDRCISGLYCPWFKEECTVSYGFKRSLYNAKESMFSVNTQWSIPARIKLNY